MLTVLTSKDKMDRLTVIVSSYSDMKLLDVPNIPNGTEEAQSTVIYDSLKQSNLTKRIHIMYENHSQ